MVRYPSRRTFLELLSHPSYAPLEPYKFMALEIDLVPVTGDKVIPDFRWIVGSGLLAIFLTVGWLRSAHRCHPRVAWRRVDDIHLFWAMTCPRSLYIVEIGPSDARQCAPENS